MSRPVVDVIRHAATWFESSPDGFGPLLESIGDARLVLIGEASHAEPSRPPQIGMSPRSGSAFGRRSQGATNGCFTTSACRSSCCSSTTGRRAKR